MRRGESVEVGKNYFALAEKKKKKVGTCPDLKNLEQREKDRGEEDGGGKHFFFFFVG